MTAGQNETADSSAIKKRTPGFLALNGMGGIVIPTNDYIKKGCLPAYAAFSFKYGKYAKGDRWQDIAYGMPYYGVGVYAANIFGRKSLGDPISIFLFQGGNLKTFSPSLSLKYEMNLGMSFNWKPYDAFDNPNNIAIGSSTNAHVGINAYLKQKLSKRFDVHVGLSLTHFSNGASQLPNKGINMAAPFVELVYNLDYEKSNLINRAALTPPPLEKRIDYDFLLTISTRQVRLDTTGTNLPSRLLDKNFKVFALSYATLFVNSYKYKWGPSVDIVYDESSKIKAWRQIHPEDGQYHDRIKLGPVGKRFSVGLSVKGELTFDRMNIFAHLGYNLLHGNKYDYRFYQIMGLKFYLKDDLFATFGIRAGHFSKAQYLYWSIGYTLKGKSLGKKDKYIHHIVP